MIFYGTKNKEGRGKKAERKQKKTSKKIFLTVIS